MMLDLLTFTMSSAEQDALSLHAIVALALVATLLLLWKWVWP